MPHKLPNRLPVYILAAILGGSAVSACTSTARAPVQMTYYVSPQGNDAAAGTSPAKAWRSLNRANSATLPPGARLLLQGGKRFSGQLTLDEHDAGSATRPVLVSSYGAGRAIIATNSPTGIAIHDTAGVDISNISLTGTAKHAASGAGINIYNDLGGNRKLDHVYVSNIDASGFANGISVGGGNGASGFRNVSISNSVLHNNLDAGLQTYGPAFSGRTPIYANENVDVSHVEAFHNRGDRANHSYSTGSGIILASVNGGNVSWSAAYDNGGVGGAVQGPEGIWAYNSTRVVIEHNISYDNHTRNIYDGSGFGLDQNTSYSYLQYNLSYGNDGAGYMLYSALLNGLQAHNVVRFNISSGDELDGNPQLGGINVSGLVSDIDVYQNTVVTRPPPKGSPALFLGVKIRKVTVRNNIFMTQAGLIVSTNGPLPPHKALLQGNDYYSMSSSWSILWGRATYSSIHTWRSATGQELIGGKPTGFTRDPNLAGPVLGLRIKTVGEAMTAGSFNLDHGSPLIAAGLDLSHLFGLHPVSQNYSGNQVSMRIPNVGAE